MHDWLVKAVRPEARTTLAVLAADPDVQDLMAHGPSIQHRIDEAAQVKRYGLWAALAGVFLVLFRFVIANPPDALRVYSPFVLVGGLLFAAAGAIELKRRPRIPVIGRLLVVVERQESWWRKYERDTVWLDDAQGRQLKRAVRPEMLPEFVPGTFGVLYTHQNEIVSFRALGRLDS